jgi:hypothetical protein
MAKDPAFLFYPADASEDTQFMNRLERGAYFDILKAQKKFVSFTLDQLKKVLGNDFDSCWGALNLVLKCENGLYFIEWVAEKIEERRKFSDSRRKNRTKKEVDLTSDKDMYKTSLTSDKDMVIVIEDEIIDKELIKKEDENFIFKKPYKTSDKDLKMVLPENYIQLSQQYFLSAKKYNATQFEILGIWEVFKGKEFNTRKEYPDKNQIFTHFINSLKFEKLENNGAGNNKSNAKLSPSEGRSIANRNY